LSKGKRKIAIAVTELTVSLPSVSPVRGEPTAKSSKVFIKYSVKRKVARISAPDERRKKTSRIKRLRAAIWEIKKRNHDYGMQDQEAITLGKKSTCENEISIGEKLSRCALGGRGRIGGEVTESLKNFPGSTADLEWVSCAGGNHSRADGTACNGRSRGLSNYE